MKHNFTAESVKNKTDRELQNLLANAARLGALDVVEIVQKELAERKYGLELPREVSIKLEAAIIAYEAVKAEEKSRSRYTATRTRQAVQRHGLKTAVERIVRNGESMGFRALPFDLSFENVILQHPESFSPDVVRTARGRKPD